MFSCKYCGEALHLEVYSGTLFWFHVTAYDLKVMRCSPDGPYARPADD